MRPDATLVLLAATLLAAGGCHNWDRLEPEQESGPTATRAFTPIGEEPEPGGPLTSEVAVRRLEAIQAAGGRERLDLIDAFLNDFREARMIPQVHRAAGEAWLAEGDPGQAADAFERALVLTRTDLLGLPLDVDLPLQLAMSALAAGERDLGLEWLARTTIADRGPRVSQALGWAHAELAPGKPLDAWMDDIREPVMAPAPTFDLPGFQLPRVMVPDPSSRATLINFWSPT